MGKEAGESAIFNDFFSYLIGALIGAIIGIPISLIIIKIRMKKSWDYAKCLKDKYMEITFDDEKVTSKIEESTSVVKCSFIPMCAFERSEKGMKFNMKI